MYLGKIGHLSSWAAEYAALPLPAPWAAASAALIVAGLLFGAGAVSAWLAAGAVLICQAALVASWIRAADSVVPWGPVAAGGVTSLLADAVALGSPRLSLENLAVVGAGSFAAAVIVQFCTRNRRNVTLALGDAMQLQLALIGLAALIVLADDANGAVAAGAATAAAGASIVIAQLSDAVTRKPSVHPLVPRGWLGIVLGIAAGAGIGALVFMAGGLSIDSTVPSWQLGATIGGVVGVVATLVDVAAAYELVGRPVTAAVHRELESAIRRHSHRPARLPRFTALAVAVRGPLLAIAFSVATGYVVTSLMPL
jgi:hypothetical protein